MAVFLAIAGERTTAPRHACQDDSRACTIHHLTMSAAIPKKPSAPSKTSNRRASVCQAVDEFGNRLEQHGEIVRVSAQSGFTAISKVLLVLQFAAIETHAPWTKTARQARPVSIVAPTRVISMIVPCVQNGQGVQFKSDATCFETSLKSTWGSAHRTRPALIRPPFTGSIRR